MRSDQPKTLRDLQVGTDKDYLATSIAYRFDLAGPAEVGAGRATVLLHRTAVQKLSSRLRNPLIAQGGSNSLQLRSGCDPKRGPALRVITVKQSDGCLRGTAQAAHRTS